MSISEKTKLKKEILFNQVLLLDAELKEKMNEYILAMNRLSELEPSIAKTWSCNSIQNIVNPTEHKIGEGAVKSTLNTLSSSKLPSIADDTDIRNRMNIARKQLEKKQSK